MTKRRASARLLDPALFGRHQAAALLATAVDFGAMIVLVELARIPPPVATFVSALLGGITNFTIERTWAYRKLHDGAVGGQAARYSVVSLGGALLNAGLLAVAIRVLRGLSVPYPVARAFVAIAVSIVYTYPLHTRFVFRARALVETDAAPSESVVPKSLGAS